MKNIKSIGRYALLLSSLSVLPFQLAAQSERKSMVVKLNGQDQSVVVFSLSEQPKYWLETNELHVMANAKSSQYTLSSVDEISFTNEQTQVAVNPSVDVSVFPNPTRDYIRVSGLTHDSSVDLTDASGVRLEHLLVIGNQEISICVEYLPDGLYFLKINGKSYKFVKK
ncbi:MAG: T9SS type A sorting domain-containing protein [Paludibacteraceae bacterium]|nr:T9SS type A sorting domain-containing protein [Paludibacteraceae bacterium]